MALQQRNGPPQQQSQQQQQQAPAPDQGDLIDFGQSDALASFATSINHAPSTPLAQQPGNAPPGLQEPLQPGQPIKRVDTLTDNLDEFVDAKPV